MSELDLFLSDFPHNRISNRILELRVTNSRSFLQRVSQFEQGRDDINHIELSCILVGIFSLFQASKIELSDVVDFSRGRIVVILADIVRATLFSLDRDNLAQIDFNVIELSRAFRVVYLDVELDRLVCEVEWFGQLRGNVN